MCSGIPLLCRFTVCKAAFRLANFLHKFSCTRKLVQENLRTFHVHITQLSCSRKWLYPLEKSDLQSIVQSATEFHDRNLPEVEHVLFLTVSGVSFLYQKNGTRNPVHTGKFSVARNLRQKLVPETCQSERSLSRQLLSTTHGHYSATAGGIISCDVCFNFAIYYSFLMHIDKHIDYWHTSVQTILFHKCLFCRFSTNHDIVTLSTFPAKLKRDVVFMVLLDSG